MCQGAAARSRGPALCERPALYLRPCPGGESVGPAPPTPSWEAELWGSGTSEGRTAALSPPTLVSPEPALHVHDTTMGCNGAAQSTCVSPVGEHPPLAAVAPRSLLAAAPRSKEAPSSPPILQVDCLGPMIGSSSQRFPRKEGYSSVFVPPPSCGHLCRHHKNPSGPGSH